MDNRTGPLIGKGNFMKTKQGLLPVVLLMAVSSIALPAQPEMTDSMRRQLNWLGVEAFPTEAQMPGLLTEKRTQIYAMTFLKYRHQDYPKAKEMVLQIFENPETSFIARLVAAETLCFYGYAGWIPEMKKEIGDPNSLYDVRSKMRIAGHMAMCGDSSQVDFVAEYVNADDERIREEAIRVLNFFAAYGPANIEDQALSLLAFAGKTDPSYYHRYVVIQMLDIVVTIAAEKQKAESNSAAQRRLADKKANALRIVHKVVSHNADAPDEQLRQMCRSKLEYQFNRP
jgi:hypothetical protein